MKRNETSELRSLKMKASSSWIELMYWLVYSIDNTLYPRKIYIIFMMFTLFITLLLLLSTASLPLSPQQEELLQLRAQVTQLQRQLAQEQLKNQAFVSFLETASKTSLSSNSRLASGSRMRADPFLKSMVSGFPHPRDYNWQVSSNNQINDQL